MQHKYNHWTDCTSEKPYMYLYGKNKFGRERHREENEKKTYSKKCKEDNEYT